MRLLVALAIMGSPFFIIVGMRLLLIAWSDGRGDERVLRRLFRGRYYSRRLCPPEELWARYRALRRQTT